MRSDWRRAGSMAATGLIAGLGLLVYSASDAGAAGNAFSGRSRAHPATRVSPAPAKPVTPPFPFRVLGRFALGSEPPQLVLGKGNQLRSVRVGDSLEGFRIDRIGDENFTATFLAAAETRTYSYAMLSAASESAGAQSPLAIAQVRNEKPMTLDRPAAAAKAPDPAPVSSPSSPAAVAPGSGGMIGGMVMVPVAPDSGGMVMTPPPAGGGMVMTAPPPGGGMEMTPPPAGATGPEGSARQQ